MELKWVEFEGRRIRLSRPEKEMWPGITKADLISYYLRVSDFILPYLKGRPLTLNLYPNGISGKNIVMKNYPPLALRAVWESLDPFGRVGRIVLHDYVLC